MFILGVWRSMSDSSLSTAAPILSRLAIGLFISVVSGSELSTSNVLTCAGLRSPFIDNSKPADAATIGDENEVPLALS